MTTDRLQGIIHAHDQRLYFISRTGNVQPRPYTRTNDALQGILFSPHYNWKEHVETGRTLAKAIEQQAHTALHGDDLTSYELARTTRSRGVASFLRSAKVLASNKFLL